MTSARAPLESRAAPAEHVPGEIGIWVFIGGDLMIFTLFFVTFAFYQAQSPALFATSQGLLNQTFGFINTIVLLTSSWFIAAAVRAARSGAWRTARRLVIATILCGLGFATIKAFEYSERVADGIAIDTNEFFIYYFTFTGIHLVHVVAGLGLLTYVGLRLGRANCGVAEIQTIEIGASFWHLVDLIWIVLFALIYLVKPA